MWNSIYLIIAFHLFNYFRQVCFLNAIFFDFDIMNFPFLHKDIPHATSYGVYISLLIRFNRVSSHVADFHTWNLNLIWLVG